MHDELESVTIKLPSSMIKKIEQLQKRGTFEISRTAVIRTLLSYGLENYRFPNERQSVGEDKSKEHP